MLAFFNRIRPSALLVALGVLFAAFGVSYFFGSRAWLPLDAAVLPIGGRYLSAIPWDVGFPLSVLLLLLGSALARQLILRYISGLTRSYLPVFLIPLLLGGLGLGGHNLLPPLVAIFLLELAFALVLQTALSPKLYSGVFRVSVLVGVASLFYLPALFFIYTPLLLLLNRSALRLRGIVVMLSGTALVPLFTFFISWLVNEPLDNLYPISLLLSLQLGDMWTWTSLNPLRPIYIFTLFLLWLLSLLWVNYPHKVHRATYFLVRNILFLSFVISCVVLFLVRDPFYMLPFLVAFLAMMLSYILAYSSGRKPTFLFVVVLLLALGMYWV